MSDKGVNERLDKIVKRLDILTVILLTKSGLSRKDIAEALGVSEKTIERLISIAKIRKGKGKRTEPEPEQHIETEADKREQGQQ